MKDPEGRQAEASIHQKTLQMARSTPQTKKYDVELIMESVPKCV